MLKADIKKLGDYVKETCERFQVWEENPTAAEAELPTLHRAIERLMRISARTKEEAVRVMLAKIEYEARKCRESILERLAMGN